MPLLYSTSKRVFFSDVKRQISLVLKVTAKMYLICFQAERQSRRQLTSFFSRQTCVNYLDVIAFVMQRYYYQETDSYKPYGFFLDPFTHYHFVCYLHIYVQFEEKRPYKLNIYIYIQPLNLNNGTCKFPFAIQCNEEVSDTPCHLKKGLYVNKYV